MFKRIFALLSLLILTNAVLAIGEESPDITGRIALIGMDYNVYTYDFATNNLNSLSQNASQTRRYQWVTWSNDGQVAYFCCDMRSSSRTSAQAFVSVDGIQAGESVYTGNDETIIYAYWSPTNCDTGADCRNLALLTNDTFGRGLSIEMLQYTPAETSHRTIEIGAPFYYQWNSDGTQLVFHRDNETIDIYDLAQDAISIAFGSISSGSFQTPAWSPLDNQILFGMSGASGTDLVVSDGENNRILVTDLQGFVSFLWSPDGRYIAYRTLQRGQVGSVVVVDAQTGDTVSSSFVDGVISFFWSPDSSKIAFVTQSNQGGRNAKPLAAQRSTDGFAWSVLDIESGSTQRYSTFMPTYEMQYMLTYFDQFASSHRIWSPDSRYLVYAEVINLNTEPEAIISMVDTSQPNSQSQPITSGVFAVWSFE